MKYFPYASHSAVLPVFTPCNRPTLFAPREQHHVLFKLALYWSDHIPLRSMEQQRVTLPGNGLTTHLFLYQRSYQWISSLPSPMPWEEASH